MSTIKVLYSQQENSLSLEETDLAHTYADVKIGFVKENVDDVVKFRRLKVILKLLKDEEILLEKTLPENEVRLISSNQEFIFTERLELEADTEYTLEISLENNKISTQNELVFSTPELPVVEVIEENQEE
jgi:hypothetical protein